MNIPVIVDVAIGLIFIYLILSLLASEIQELISTVFQWRAKHLKESIETLLAGGSENIYYPSKTQEEISKTRQLANDIYSHPLINTLNYEKTGPLAEIFRNSVRWIDNIARKIERNWKGTSEDIFRGKNSAPSYITGETFATTILETLQIYRIVRELTAEKIDNFNQELLGRIDNGWSYILADPYIGEETRFNLNKDRIGKIINLIGEDLKNGNLTLPIAIKRITTQLDEYIVDAENLLPEGETKRKFIRQIKQLRQNVYIDQDTAMLLDSYSSSVLQVIQAYKELKELSKSWKSSHNNPEVEQKLRDFYQKSPIHIKIEKINNIYCEENGETLIQFIERLPENLINSLAAIAERTQTTIEDVEEEIKEFQQGVEQWFDRGMERAQGVYKRNAKGVAFCIGLLIAITLNADTFYIVNRLSKDTALRTVIVQEATQAESSGDLEIIQDEVKQALEEVALPIGWSESNRELQKEEREKWTFYNIELGMGRQFVGWVVTGIAIAMGAPFWFDLLSRAINVRNTGKKTSY
ncbi:MAG: hypothetical protein F6K10_07885 [Moorea sp. SIO2B7]|nr:hypothetical protein [Moorena sp. SIO2B7]